MWTAAQELAYQNAKDAVASLERERSLAETHVRNDIIDFVREVCNYSAGTANADFAEKFIFTYRKALLAFLQDLPPLER